ncbi:hypothetical protein [Luteimonas lutimaris]|uniref:Uncharacterized protein n=1 Tax=Luteimonas lutimaris TaxID=698645 RepID=A0ABP7N085_9GAMM
MADRNLPPSTPPANWHEAFAALPLEEAPPGGWNVVSRQLDAQRQRRRPRWMLPLATAAALALAAVPVWLQRQSDAPHPALATPPAVATQPQDDAGNGEASAIAQLQAESARLEALLRYARDGRVASGAAAAMAMQFDARLAAVDAALMQPGLAPTQQSQLWRERVELLRASAGMESTRRWLAAQGRQYQPALVHVD